eukprot:TRINITY_DN6793_c0_g1_i35.p1 TRINITY_DN6793_c0_g1~~TRINITY_DN6793_c0_g1_i35.p1  ORF type:complete len:236 (+),score=-23.44 TRINITY_DN6793_c0_g1_i35:198-905(+)
MSTKQSYPIQPRALSSNIIQKQFNKRTILKQQNPQSLENNQLINSTTQQYLFGYKQKIQFYTRLFKLLMQYNRKVTIRNIFFHQNIIYISCAYDHCTYILYIYIHTYFQFKPPNNLISLLVIQNSQYQNFVQQKKGYVYYFQEKQLYCIKFLNINPCFNINIAQTIFQKILLLKLQQFQHTKYFISNQTLKIKNHKTLKLFIQLIIVISKVQKITKNQLTMQEINTHLHKQLNKI